MALSSKDIRLSDDFSDKDGCLVGYDCYDLVQREALQAQRHRDIRSFRWIVHSEPYDMDSLSALTMDDLAVKTMEDLSSGSEMVYDEQWTSDLDPAYVAGQGTATTAEWPVLYIECPPFDQILAESVMPNAPVDLWTGFSDADVITMAMPEFPSAGFSPGALANCYVAFVSSSGSVSYHHWDEGLTVAAGDWAELRIPRSDLWSGVAAATRESNIRSVTGVRILIDWPSSAAGSPRVKIAALRLVAADWTVAPLDMDTRLNRIRRPATLNGDPAGATTFPPGSISDPYIPNEWPILFRSDTPAGSDDPRPIDLTAAVIFDTGVSTTAGEIRLYFREVTEDPVTQLDLEAPTPETMASLDALGKQPDFGRAEFLARTQTDLNAETQIELDGVPQLELGSKPDYHAAGWAQVTLAWSPGAATITVSDTEGNVMTFPVSATLDGAFRYAFVTRIEETHVSLSISELTVDNLFVGGPIFSSTAEHGGILSRRGGRFGWWADLSAGDAFIEEVRAYEPNYAEYRSHPMQSITPVAGAQLFYGGSPAREGVVAVTAQRGALLTADPAKSVSGTARSITGNGAVTRQGVTTNLIEISSFEDAVVSFDVLVPSNTDMDVAAFLSDEFGNRMQLNVGRIQRDRWHTVEIKLANAAATWLPGKFAVQIVQPSYGVAATWWIDNVSVRQPSLVWSARAHDADPWGDDNTPWVPFREIVNSNTGGVMFDRPGRALQSRAIARTSVASLTTVKLLPKYAALGRLVWEDANDTINDVPDPTLPLTVDIQVVSGASGTYTYPDGTTTTIPKIVRGAVGLTQRVAVDPSSPHQPVLFEWDFGDGTTMTVPTEQAVVNLNYVNYPGDTVRVSLCVTTARGLKVCVGKQLVFA